ncbi:MAG: hypothetical protein DRG35_04175 [Deltaproteobacteria bacterium]|nr:MAG: hypothetical protein DRG35_04175 [Deltaproteobacteria bacterium]
MGSGKSAGNRCDLRHRKARLDLFPRLRIFNKSALLSSENMLRGNSSGEGVRYISKWDNSVVLKEENIQEKSRTSISGNSYP